MWILEYVICQKRRLENTNQIKRYRSDTLITPSALRNFGYSTNHLKSLDSYLYRTDDYESVNVYNVVKFWCCNKYLNNLALNVLILNRPSVIIQIDRWSNQIKCIPLSRRFRDLLGLCRYNELQCKLQYVAIYVLSTIFLDFGLKILIWKI